jgi:aminoglycoside phosphotransferase (APT) family kinase protein
MHSSDLARGKAAAMKVASTLGLPVAEAQVLHNSNKLALRLIPCDVVARVAFAGQEVFRAELEIARQLAATQTPVGQLAPGVEPWVYGHNEFVVTLWSYYEQLPEQVPPAEYAQALVRMHHGMAKVDVDVPHFSDRVAEAQQLVASRAQTPALAEADRDLLSSTLRIGRRAITERADAEQLLHGEPHPGNLLNTKNGPLFIDLETCCRGPVEFDLAHVPERVTACYPRANGELLRAARLLVLAMVAAWRWDRSDQLPNGERAGQELLKTIRDGPPWPALDVVMRKAGVS